jgi:hypothetical protein
VMTYAVPMLAERAHVAGRAQRATVRRPDGEAPVRVLSDVVARQLPERGVEPEAVEWDAWRRDDGRWTLVADYRSGETPRHAEFTFDVAGSYVVADDDEARWLLGEIGSPATQARAGAGRRLASVPADELPLGEDAIELVTEPAAPAERRADPTDWIARPTTESVDAGSRADHAVDHPVELGSEADEDDEDTARVAQVARAVGETPRGGGSRKRRPTVPSWDEIMFGGGAGDPTD